VAFRVGSSLFTRLVNTATESLASFILAHSSPPIHKDIDKDGGNQV
jgi:hypothetical protein